MATRISQLSATARWYFVRFDGQISLVFSKKHRNKRFKHFYKMETCMKMLFTLRIEDTILFQLQGHRISIEAWYKEKVHLSRPRRHRVTRPASQHVTTRHSVTWRHVPRDWPRRDAWNGNHSPPDGSYTVVVPFQAILVYLFGNARVGLLLRGESYHSLSYHYKNIEKPLGKLLFFFTNGRYFLCMMFNIPMFWAVWFLMRISAMQMTHLVLSGHFAAMITIA